MIAPLEVLEAVYVARDGQAPIKLDKGILALHRGSYAFLDPKTWTISFDRLRRLAWNESYCVGGDNYPRTPDRSLVELMCKMKAGASLNRLSDDVPDELPDTLLHFEGLPLFISDQDAATIAKNFRATENRTFPPHRPGKIAPTADLITKHWPDGDYPSAKRIIRELLEKDSFSVGRTTVIKAKKLAAKARK